jgi:hypothetical protein
MTPMRLNIRFLNDEEAEGPPAIDRHRGSEKTLIAAKAIDP